jgi:hypothetical protein
MMFSGREKSGFTFFLSLALTIIWCSAAQGKTVTIDDSGTQVLDPAVAMRWKTATPARNAADNVMVGGTTVRVRINVMPWLKHSGKIYLSLPMQQPGPISAVWSAQGQFRSGQMRSGDRILVYSGPITTPFMEDVLRFQFSVNGVLMRRSFPVNFHFEMDED